MPKLFYSSETWGNGATIELDSGDHCIISVAQAGVLVRSYRPRGIGALFGSFLGPVLYNEKNVYKAAKTGMALTSQFPDLHPELNFKSPVLAAFANAVWHCSTPAQVSIVLNEAMSTTGANKPPDTMAAIFALSQLLSRYPSAILDASLLPLPKPEMRLGIKAAWMQSTNQEFREWLEVGYLFLSHFQDDVGHEPVESVAMPDIKDPKDLSAWMKDFEIWTDWQKKLSKEMEMLSIEFNEWKITHGHHSDANAFNDQGDIHITGRGVPENYAEAAKWYKKAADLGHAKAQSQLGHMYVTGRGVTQNYAEATKWLRKAADNGIAAAQSQLGDMYIKGQGVLKNYAEAAKWCRLAADQGNTGAQLLLGSMYHNGEGVSKDYVQALMWLTLAAAVPAPKAGEADNKAVSIRDFVAAKMTREQIAKAQHLAREWKPL